VMAIALLAASLGTSWFYVTLSGFAEFKPLNATQATPNEEVPFYYEIYESILHLDTAVTFYGVNRFTHSCTYSDGVCENLANTWYNEIANGILTGVKGTDVCVSPHCEPVISQRWDLNSYLPPYAAILAITLTAILVIVFLAILLQVICWTYDRWSPKLTLALLIVAIVFIEVLLLSAWCIEFGHDQYVRDSLSVGTSWCAGGDSLSKEKGNILCTWNGSYQYDQYTNTYDRFFNFDWRNMQITWGPNTAWVLYFIGFGHMSIVFLLVVGWRPAIKF